VRQLNEFLARFEEDLCETDRVDEDSWCPEHVVTRQGPKRRFVFLRNPSRDPRRVPTPEAERSTLAPWETQIRVYTSAGQLEGVSPAPVARISPREPALDVELPRLESWDFCGASPQIDTSYDDSSWTEIPASLLERQRIDMDTLGVHYGFIWYRGTFQRPLERLILDARHCWSVWVNRELVGSGDQFRNTLGVGPEGARRTRIPVRKLPYLEGRNTIAILVESLGHHKGFADDVANPRGLVGLDTGGTPIDWRFRGGLIRGERDLAPVVAFEGVERTQMESVVLPHGWAGDPQGVGLYETRFRLDGIDPERTQVGVSFDPGQGKANLYLNGYLLGRYWPERGPQQRFPLPWGVLREDEENHLAIALWKRSERAALGRVRLEPI
jgi:beta-galactosidase